MGENGGRQNVTLAVPSDVLAAAKHLAIDDATTLSGLFAELVTAELARRGGRAEALERIRARLRTGYPLGTNGAMPVPRDELHER